LLVESVTDYAIFVLDSSGHIRSWNPGAERLKGYSESEIIGKHFSTFYSADDLIAGKPARELDIATRSGRVEDEGWRVRKDGSRFWANVVITALRDETGTLLGFAKITRDLTARKQAEERTRELAAETAARQEAEQNSEQLRQLADELQQQALELESQTEEAQSLTEELEETNERLSQEAAAAEEARAAADAANRAKTEFLAVMSHELRTPLNAISGYVELLDMQIAGPVTEQQRSYLSRIQNSEQHLLALLEDVLGFARLETGRLAVSVQPVIVYDAIVALEGMLELEMQKKRLTFGRPTPDPSLVARADPEKLRQILLNLLANGVKFTPEGGQITVGAERVRDMVRVWVKDTGIGIPSDQLNNVFDPFYQVDRGPTRKYPGMGLGLAIARDLARAMKGDVWLESTPGQGSTAWLALPAA
jgi:PAS domain S-box-containing protein